MASPLICVLLLHVITLNEGISVHDATQGLHVLIIKPYSAHKLVVNHHGLFTGPGELW